MNTGADLEKFVIKTQAARGKARSIDREVEGKGCHHETS